MCSPPPYRLLDRSSRRTTCRPMSLRRDSVLEFPLLCYTVRDGAGPTQPAEGSPIRSLPRESCQLRVEPREANPLTLDQFIQIWVLCLHLL